jgi:hypothetical protein
MSRNNFDYLALSKEPYCPGTIEIFEKQWTSIFETIRFIYYLILKVNFMTRIP